MRYKEKEEGKRKPSICEIYCMCNWNKASCEARDLALGLSHLINSTICYVKSRREREKELQISSKVSDVVEAKGSGAFFLFEVHRSKRRRNESHFHGDE